MCGKFAPSVFHKSLYMKFSNHQIFKFLTAALVLAALPLNVDAHPSHLDQGQGLLAGIMHPLLGWDHVLAMTALGIWASIVGGKAFVSLPVGCISGMIAGAMATAAGVYLHRPDAAIALSLIIAGVVALFGPFRLRQAQAWAAICSVIVGFFQGFAHASEMPRLVNAVAFGTG
jgi:urease accessory protein